MAATKRQGPLDDEQILQDWREIHRHYTQDLRLSNRRSFTLIGRKYGYSRSGIQYWIEENVRRRSIQRKRDTLVPYSKDPRKLERRSHSRVYQHIRRRPDIFLQQVYDGRNKALSVDDITLRLHQRHGILLRNKTLENILTQYREKTGQKLVTPTNEKPTRYYLRR